ncbi:MAG: hypothetical protein KDN22_32285, partial [Verrucomicrobiae bacterium]|nr:hypothetical protein [Verrucomicrobiae bacterium]
MSLEIAVQRIAEEARAQTGFLDLGNLGLDEIPDQLFALTHLTTVILNRSTEDFILRWGLEEGALSDSQYEVSRPNRFRADDQRLSSFVNLETLVCAGTQFCDLSPLANLKALNSLDCSRTEVSDLSP